MNIRILHPGPGAQTGGIPESMGCRILVFMWHHWQTRASSHEVTVKACGCWEYTKIGLSSGFGIFVICPDAKCHW